MIQIKRAYEKASPKDGRRVLVDRLWPRGVSKERAKLYRWEKDIAPSTELRTWFNHDPKKWREFTRRYRSELRKKPELVEELRSWGRGKTLTLVYAAKDEMHNEAAVLAKILE